MHFKTYMKETPLQLMNANLIDSNIIKIKNTIFDAAKFSKRLFKKILK